MFELWRVLSEKYRKESFLGGNVNPKRIQLICALLTKKREMESMRIY